MDIDRIRYFCMVAQTGSLTEAARLLHVSQPALSKAMKLLETEVGVPLLLPQGRGLTITDQGRRFAERAQQILQDLVSLQDHLRSQDAHNLTKISLASFEVFTTYFLGDFIAKNWSDFDISIHELIPGEMEEAIAKNFADFGISYMPIPHPELDVIQVGTIKMGIYSQNKKYKDQPFESWPFVIPIHPIHGVPTKTKGLDGWPEDQLKRQIQFRVGMMETALELCRQGVAVAYLPQFVVKLHNEGVRAERALKELPAPAKLKQKSQAVHLIKRKSTPESKLFRDIAKALRKI